MDEHKLPFIGKTATVVDASTVSIIGVKGTVVDETAQTFILEVAGQEKTIIKKGTTFMIDGLTIKGELVCKRPEERIKTKKRRT